MDLDVVYYCDTNNIDKNIKRYIDDESINLIVFKTFPSKFDYENKKIIWNAIRKMRPDGCFCIECVPENISDIIRILYDKGIYYQVSCVIFDNILANDSCRLFIVAFKSKIFIPQIDTYIKVEDATGLAKYILSKTSQFGNFIACIGDDSYLYSQVAKNLGRYILLFCNKISFSTKNYNGLMEVDLNG